MLSGNGTKKATGIREWTRVTWAISMMDIVLTSAAGAYELGADLDKKTQSIATS